MDQIIELIPHTDDALSQLVSDFGNLTYVMLFLIILYESGIILFPFIPGNGLLFSAGIIASRFILNIFILFPLFLFTAIIGDNVNYCIGKFTGNKLICIQNRYYQKYILQATIFYSKSGDKAILIRRFFPILRTYVPFIVGLANMQIKKFLLFSILGAFLWISLYLLLGYFIGEIPYKANYGLIYWGWS